MAGSHPSLAGHCGETRMNGNCLPAATSFGGPCFGDELHVAPALAAAVQEEHQRELRPLLLAVVSGR